MKRPQLMQRRMPRLANLVPALVVAAATTLALTGTSPGRANAAQADRTQAAAPDADSPSGFYYGTRQLAQRDQ